MNKFYIDRDKSIDCLILLKDFFKEIDTIACVEVPSDLKYGSDEWFCYIFYSCLLDYGMRSKIYHKNLVETYKNYPQIFNFKFVVEHYSENREELFIILKENVHPRYPNVAVDKWICLAKELAKYKSLKDEIMNKRSFDELSQFIRKMNGYGQKTGGLLLRLIRDSEICGFTDEIKAIPLDRHDVDICYMNGIINKSRLNDKEISVLSTSLIECGKELDLLPSDVDKYLWEIGNRFCNQKNCGACPLRSSCVTKLK